MSEVRQSIDACEKPFELGLRAMDVGRQIVGEGNPIAIGLDESARQA